MERRGGLISAIRSYYRGSRGRDQREFYDLESSLPYFDDVNRIVCRDKRRIFFSFLPPADTAPGGLRILELGCGNGHFARLLAARGYRVSGVDISPRKLAKARAAGAGPGYHEGDISSLDRDPVLAAWLDAEASAEANGRFGAVLAADVIEHVAVDPRDVLRAVKERIAPGGRLLVSVPSRLCVNDPGHIWRYLPDEWVAVFEECGLRVCRREMSRISWFRLRTPLPLAEIFHLEPCERRSP